MARELAPVGPRSGPALLSEKRGLLRSPTGASSLATGYSPFCAVTYSPASSHNHDNYSQRLGATLPVPHYRRPRVHRRSILRSRQRRHV
ncbi:hypothetical protein EIY72_18415 [Pseudomonas vancouverensis]|uniref:Uncharacterized protein n=1 Tax=Pseudomonas vancouverensis TaxID=95300 RepID=A0A4R4JXH4_PSEVA|nr:hypothetical protein F7R09_26245 [Pseudomonas vancouverensis]TDB59587.1 hypothetical protein EIY72_18415 [Pseudomonas vancouverensis]